MVASESISMNRIFDDTKTMSIRQTRKGWLQECLGCEAQTEFKWFNTTGGDAVKVAESLEDSSCCVPFDMVAREDGSNDEIFTMKRDLNCPAGPCKCCCFQKMDFNVESTGSYLGSVNEDCYLCVPSITVKGPNGQDVYIISPPTCCGGMCINDCADDGESCCLCTETLYVYKPYEYNGGEMTPSGKIVKKRTTSEILKEVFKSVNAFDVNFPEDATIEENAPEHATIEEKAMLSGSVDVGFPEDATIEEKALLLGSAMYINTLYFETNKNNAFSILKQISGLGLLGF